MLSTQDDAAWRPCVNRSLVIYARESGLVPKTRVDSSKALTKQIGHFDEESSSVAAEARLELIGKRTEAVAIEIVVVSDIESRPRIRRPAKEELPFNV